MARSPASGPTRAVSRQGRLPGLRNIKINQGKPGLPGGGLSPGSDAGTLLDTVHPSAQGILLAPLCLGAKV